MAQILRFVLGIVLLATGALGAYCESPVIVRPRLEQVLIKFENKNEIIINVDAAENISCIMFGDHGVAEILCGYYEKTKGNQSTAMKILDRWKNDKSIAFYIKDKSDNDLERVDSEKKEFGGSSKIKRPCLEYVKLKFAEIGERVIAGEKAVKLSGIFFDDRAVNDVLAGFYEKFKNNKNNAEKIKNKWKNEAEIVFYTKDMFCADNPEY